MYSENREFHQIFPDVIEPALRLRVARGYPREQYEVHNLYTGAARYDTIEIYIAVVRPRFYRVKVPSRPETVRDTSKIVRLTVNS